MKNFATNLIKISPSLLVVALLFTFLISGSIQIYYYHTIFSAFITWLPGVWILAAVGAIAIQLTRLATSTLGASFSVQGDRTQAQRTWIAGGLVTLIEIAEVYLMGVKINPDLFIPFLLFGVFFTILSYMLEIQFTLSMFQQEQREAEEAEVQKVEDLRKDWEVLSKVEKKRRIQQAEQVLQDQGMKPILVNIAELLGVGVSTISKYKKVAA